MTIYQLLKIGEAHTNFCEDAILSIPINEKKHLLAVMDGCSSGHESHFASGLISKLLKKQVTEISYLEYATNQNFTLKDYQKKILNGIFEDLKAFKNKYHLQTNELLSTLILAVFDKNQWVEIFVAGDGLVQCDDSQFEFDQDDQPEYLAYHLNESFEQWYENQNQVLSFEIKEHFTISTDGIYSFQPFDHDDYPQIEQEDLLNLFLLDKSGRKSVEMLHKKALEIEREFGLKPMDDLGILKVIFK